MTGPARPPDQQLADFGTNALIQELAERGDLGLAAKAYRRHRPRRWWKRRDGWPIGNVAPEALSRRVEALETVAEYEREERLAAERRVEELEAALSAALASVSARPKPYTPDDHASSMAARRYENHLEQIKDHGP